MRTVTTIQHRRGTTAEWTAKNPVLAFGEFGIETTGATIRSKIGDGATPWVNLPYADTVTDPVFQAPVGLNADTVDSDISYTISASTGATGLPPGAPPVGYLETVVLIPSSFRPKYQRYGTTNPAQLWSRFSGGSGWSAWTRLDGTNAIKQTSTVSADLNTEPVGSVTAFNSTTLNRPVDGTGSVVTNGVLADTNRQQLALVYGSNPQLLMRFSSGSTWGGWKRMDAGVIPPITTTNPPSSPAAFKAVPLALTAGGGSNAGDTSGNFRMPVRFGARINRWRVHIRNNNPRFGTDGPAAAISSVYFGAATTGGQFTVAPTLIASSLSTGTSGAVTPWQTTPIIENTQYALAYAFTAASTNRVVGGGWSASSVNSTTATLTTVVNLPLDVWIEAEVAPDVPVVAAFGDSLSAGVGATLPVYDSWLSQWCRTNAALPVHYAASGDTMQGWVDSLAYKWQRWQKLARPDAVVHAMGSNDVFGGASLTTMNDRRAVSLEQLRTLVSDNVYSFTIMPREGSTWDAMESVRRSYNDGIKTRTDTRDAFDIVQAVSLDDETLIDSIDADGIHLTTAGYAAVANTITRPLASTLGTRVSNLERSTGWRNITHPDLTAGKVQINRVGSRVYMNWDAAVFGTLTGHVYLAGIVPDGFRTNVWIPFQTVTVYGPSIGCRLVDTTANGGPGTVHIAGLTSGAILRAYVMWETSQPWPTTLPGTPA